MKPKGTKAVFTISLADGRDLTAVGKFLENGHNVALVTYHTRLAPWIRLPGCSLAQLRTAMNDAAASFGGSMSVHYLPYDIA
jgi:hypothetical protein